MSCIAVSMLCIAVSL